MSNALIQRFINDYKDEDKQHIQCSWISTTDSDGEDRNYEFRQAVIEAVFPQIDTVPLELVRDLYLAETELSAKIFCIDSCAAELATTMLERGRVSMLDAYFEGRSKSWDAYCSCGGLVLDNQLIHEFIKELERRTEQATDDDERAFCTEMIRQFGFCLRD